MLSYYHLFAFFNVLLWWVVFLLLHFSVYIKNVAVISNVPDIKQAISKFYYLCLIACPNHIILSGQLISERLLWQLFVGIHATEQIRENVEKKCQFELFYCITENLCMRWYICNKRTFFKLNQITLLRFVILFFDYEIIAHFANLLFLIKLSSFKL